jgi:hypothetical protein
MNCDFENNNNMIIIQWKLWQNTNKNYFEDDGK